MKRLGNNDAQKLDKTSVHKKKQICPMEKQVFQKH